MIYPLPGLPPRTMLELRYLFAQRWSKRPFPTGHQLFIDLRHLKLIFKIGYGHAGPLTTGSPDAPADCRPADRSRYPPRRFSTVPPPFFYRYPTLLEGKGGLLSTFTPRDVTPIKELARAGDDIQMPHGDGVKLPGQIATFKVLRSYFPILAHTLTGAADRTISFFAIPIVPAAH